MRLLLKVSHSVLGSKQFLDDLDPYHGTLCHLVNHFAPCRSLAASVKKFPLRSFSAFLETCKNRATLLSLEL